MNIDDCVIGMKVTAPIWGEDVGTIESVDHDDYIVYVRFSIPGQPGRSDVMDIDPGDLAPA